MMTVWGLFYKHIEIKAYKESNTHTHTHTQIHSNRLSG